MVKTTPTRERPAQGMMLMLLRLDPRFASPLFFGPRSCASYWKPVGENQDRFGAWIDAGASDAE
ncbi:MAG: hypothetical protein AB7P20_06140 [Rhizobiaceae bacterium]